MENKENSKIKLRTVFMGTSDLSKIVLERLILEEYNLVGIFTKQDKKIGRKQELMKPPVKTIAEEKNIPVFQPIKFNEDAIKNLSELKPDLVIVAAYGKILPLKALEIPGFGCINVHVSILPKYRGASPIQNAIINGDEKTGVTIMLMDENMDTGDILSQEEFILDKNKTYGEIFPEISKNASELLIKTIPDWIERKIKPKKQDHSSTTMCQLIEREDGRIFWSNSAIEIYNQYRGLTPWPGVFTFWKNGTEISRIKLLSINLSNKKNTNDAVAIGKIFEFNEEICVKTGDGIIILKEIQKEGKQKMNIRDFINGYPKFLESTLH